MSSSVAVACLYDPDAFIARFGVPDGGAIGADGLSVLFGEDFVVVNTPLTPRVTIEFALSVVERALPGLQGSSEAVAVGLGGGTPGAATTFEEWARHWIRGSALQAGQQMVARAIFGTVIRDSVAQGTTSHANGVDRKE